ncbi:MAG: 50S ribosomal protein L3 [Planctomycetota bacterium]
MIGILGKKLGMTQIWNDKGDAVPVTVVQAGPCTVMQVRSKDRDGYSAVQLGFEDKRVKSALKPELGHAKKANATPKRFIRELRYKETVPVPFKEGEVITVKVLEGIRLVDVIGTSRGRGFQGGMRRHGFHGAPASHGTEKTHRAIGSVGRGHAVNKGILPGKRMPGHMGDCRVTAIGLTLEKFDSEQNLAWISGAVPGSSNGYLIIRKSRKDRPKKAPPVSKKKGK